MPLTHSPKTSLRTISVRKCLNTFARGYQLVRAITCTVPVLSFFYYIRNIYICKHLYSYSFVKVRKQSRKSILGALKLVLFVFVFLLISLSSIPSLSIAAGNDALIRNKESSSNCIQANMVQRADGTCVPNFIPLVGIPYIDNPKEIGSMAEYVSALYKISISIAAFLAVIKIIFAGVKYMLSDVVTDKGAAKKDIRGALIGLLIVIGAVLILNTINPQLRNLNVLKGPGVDITLRTPPPPPPGSITEFCEINQKCFKQTCPVTTPDEVCINTCELKNGVYDNEVRICAHTQPEGISLEDINPELASQIQGNVAEFTNQEDMDSIVENRNKNILFRIGPYGSQEFLNRRRDYITQCLSEGGSTYDVFYKLDVEKFVCYE